MTDRPDERDVYREMWQKPEYRAYSPGENAAQTFLAHAKPRKGASVLDLGCGTGRGGLMLAVVGGLNVTLLDFADNCLDADIRPMLDTQAHVMRFVEADLTKPLPCVAEYGFSVDVLEHIPPESVAKVLDNCLHAAQHCFFQIATQPDVMGSLIGHSLHLSVHDFAWWLERFRERDCVIHWSQDLGGAVQFYVSAWQDGQAIVDVGVLNTEEAKCLENVRYNTGWHHADTKFTTPQGGCCHPDSCAFGMHGAALRILEDADIHMAFANIEGVKFGPFDEPFINELDYHQDPADEVRILYWYGNSNLYYPTTLATWEKMLTGIGADSRWQQVEPHPTNDTDVMIVGGGPSTAQNLDEIRLLRAAGVKLITLNGAYNWCLENGLQPSAQIVVDARPFNARFVKPVVPDCKYLIASQCDPSVFEGLPHDRTYIWHTSASFIRPVLDEAYKVWYGIPGGSTVLLRAIPLLRLLGFRKFTLFGADSCVMDGAAHAYSQPENNGEPVLPVIVGGRTFQCTPAHVAQCEEFQRLIQCFGNEVELDVRGDGLLAWIIEHAANMVDEHKAQWLSRRHDTHRKRALAKRRRRM